VLSWNKLLWYPKQDLNLRPTAYQAAALPLSYPGVGSSGKIRTYTVHRMKVLHYHYATLPYRNTLMNQPDAAVRLANRFQFVSRFSWYSVCTGFRSPQCNHLQGQLVCFCMVGAVRLELTTYRLKADYSNQLSYAPIRIPYSWNINAANLCLF